MALLARDDDPGLMLKAAAVLIGLSVPTIVLGRSFLQGALALALILVLTHWIATRRNPLSWDDLKRPAVIACAVMVLAWLPAVIFSFDPSKSVGTWARTAVFMAGAGAFWLMLRERPELIGLVGRVMVAAMVVFAFVGLLSATVASDLFIAFRGGMPLAKLKLTTVAMATALPVMFALSLTLDRRWWIPATLAAILVVVLTWVIGSRSALAGIGAVIVVIGLIKAWKRKSIPWLIVAVAPVVLFILAGAVMVEGRYNPGLEELVYMPVWLIDPARQLIWQFVWNAFLESPLIGHGIDVINRIPGASERIDWFQMVPSHPHNALMELLAETGLVGTIPVVAATIAAAIAALRRMGSASDLRPLGQIAFLSAFWGAALFAFSIWSSWWLLMAFVLFALVDATERFGHPQGRAGAA